MSPQMYLCHTCQPLRLVSASFEDLHLLSDHPHEKISASSPMQVARSQPTYESTSTRSRIVAICDDKSVLFLPLEPSFQAGKATKIGPERKSSVRICPFVDFGEDGIDLYTEFGVPTSRGPDCRPTRETSGI
jgi:hypothetical protein